MFYENVEKVQETHTSWNLKYLISSLCFSKHLTKLLSQRIYPAPPLSITRPLSQPIICGAPAASDFICELFTNVLSHTFCGECAGT